ncbi:cobalt transporter CbiM [Dactylosporangium vinaceum]|uniref:Cobalt transporter CbiM n=1 Tax=Dactylosporangium vinaceum TaxID=53362 RepID=A0ABV5MRX4_9ACTN|nr:cobalt transporter CbiM [Dactylosporangium vinaceum]UAC00328.1 cobalt transporter CbiM [Dactylosporangium vinaceum]
MHIPDGYLSPQTSAVFGLAMLPLWWQSAARVKKVVKSRYVPLVALGAAFSFVIMMFNIPIPDGTTAHAVGGGLIAILLGPWAACIAVSIALLIQALFFGDGGILAFPANAFNMAVVLPFVSYGIYRLLTRNTALTSPRRMWAAIVGAYAGLNLSALATAIEFGIQPDLFHKADGTPLYAPFHLSQAIPAMMLAHLLIAGVVEGVLTGGVVAYLQRANVPLLRINAPEVPLTQAEVQRRPVSPVRAALVTLGIMAVISPLGLLAPGGAFGEDAPQDLDLGRYGLSAVPEGLAKYTGFWGRTLLPDYGGGSWWQYVLSAVIGIAVVVALVFGVTWLIGRLRGGEREAADLDAPPVRS